MSGWVKALLNLIGRLLLGQAERQAIRKAKIQGLKTYLKVLQGVRLSAIGVLSVLMVVHILTLGLLVMVGALIWLAPWEPETKLWVLFGVGASLFFLPVLTLGVALSERVWYRASGAQAMVDEVLEK